MDNKNLLWMVILWGFGSGYSSVASLGKIIIIKELKSRLFVLMIQIIFFLILPVYVLTSGYFKENYLLHFGLVF